jgi:hypothetical protein
VLPEGFRSPHDQEAEASTDDQRGRQRVVEDDSEVVEHPDLRSTPKGEHEEGSRSPFQHARDVGRLSHPPKSDTPMIDDTDDGATSSASVLAEQDAA